MDKKSVDVFSHSSGRVAKSEEIQFSNVDSIDVHWVLAQALAQTSGCRFSEVGNIRNGMASRFDDGYHSISSKSTCRMNHPILDKSATRESRFILIHHKPVKPNGWQIFSQKSPHKSRIAPNLNIKRKNVFCCPLENQMPCTRATQNLCNHQKVNKYLYVYIPVVPHEAVPEVSKK